MKNSNNDTRMLTAKAEASYYKTAQLEQALAQLEATLSREENKKVSEKSKKT